MTSIGFKTLLPHSTSRLTSGSIQTLNNPWTTAHRQCFLPCLVFSRTPTALMHSLLIWSPALILDSWSLVMQAADLWCSDSWSTTCIPVSDNSFLSVTLLWPLIALHIILTSHLWIISYEYAMKQEHYSCMRCGMSQCFQHNHSPNMCWTLHTRCLIIFFPFVNLDMTWIHLGH